ncbi:MAG: beta-eliminating lyase-related protein [Chitinophagaceae bacterium]|jgi:threonine aldolase|nr:beta-eliminating lyase-related protein [Chitinophagaceae bacterium]MCE2834536.1 beta-eliminating lyase-related protein [Chitinophagaceae bacterium]
MRIDFRSDTVTRPTPEMQEAMHMAPLGDDVFGEDPAINALEGMASDLFGMEAALFCPSGTMTNQIAIKCHTQPGDEVICDLDSHIYQYEGGGIAFNAGCSVRLLSGDRGRITAEQVSEGINAVGDVHKAVSRLVSLENTANRGGGSCYELTEIERIREVCDRHGLALHLDGARLFNALVAQGGSPRDHGRLFDSISICLSKGLGAPVGSLLLGTSDFIKRSRRIRKVFGGGMRQAGMLAAAGQFALEHHVERLAEDHRHAAAIAAALEHQPFIERVLPVETNIIIAEMRQPWTPLDLQTYMQAFDIRFFAISPRRFRLVVHLDITPAMVERTIGIINDINTLPCSQA